nr:ATP-grasp domain-containing protein [Bacillus sp. SM2101]
MDERWVIDSAILANYFNVPSVGLQAAVISRNKEKQRELVKETPWGVHSQKLSISQLKTTELPKSGVIKPIDKYGSVNVVIWSNKEQGQEVLNSIDLEDTSQIYLLEDRIDGQEYSIESWVQNGTIVYSSITKKETLSSNGIEFPVEVGHEVHFTNLPEELMNEVEKMNEFVIRESKIKNAIVHLEFKVNHQGIPKIMEWSVRNPGDRIMDLYLYAGAVNPYDLYVQVALGENVDNIDTPKKKVFQKYLTLEIGSKFERPYDPENPIVYWPSHPEYQGFVRKEQGIKFSDNQEIYLYEIGILIQHGHEIKAVTDSLSRHIYVVYSENQSSLQNMDLLENILKSQI